MQLKDKLRQLREQANLSQQEVSEKIGVSRSAYAYYEVGQSHPKLATLQNIAKLYNISTDDLLTEDKVAQDISFKTSWSTDNRFNELTDYEQSIILKSRMLTKDQKIELMDFINNL